MMNMTRRLRLALEQEPRPCAGDWVEVKSKAEILASLDEKGTLEGMPFMPEMLKYCGHRFRVYKRAHKTCDFSTGMEARRVPAAVHLENLRCSGEAHGGCQAECLLFWKEAWLKPVASGSSSPEHSEGDDSRGAGGCSEAHLQTATIESMEPEPIYACQNTLIPRFTTPLRNRDLDQYVEAFTSGNVLLREMFSPFLFRAYERLVRTRLGATGLPQGVYDLFQRLRGGIPYPHRRGRVPAGQKTPVGTRLDLKPGELVRVKSFTAILDTLNSESRNRGLLFSQEMVPYCGLTFRVRSRVSRIIDEKTGKMLKFGNDCIILEDVICRGSYNGGQIFCPRGNYPYWRELWLERVTSTDSQA